MNKRVIVTTVLAGIALMASNRAYAQDRAPQQAAALVPSQGLSDEDINLLRKDIRSLKKQIIAANINLTETEAQQFWPIYDRYMAEMVKIVDKKFDLLKEYATNYDSMTDAVYKGLALANAASGPQLYAANFNSGKVDVFDTNFAPVTTAGTFTDPNIPAGFAPFNIANLGGKLYVTYAMQNDEKHDDVAGPGNGFVDVYDLSGTLLQRLISAGPLNSPWGLVIAPANFGSFSNALLVGNFGDGTINAFDVSTGSSLGVLQNKLGNPISIEGLWALQFGNGGNGGAANTLYFTAGIAGGGAVEDHGLFGSLQAADNLGACAN